MGAENGNKVKVDYTGTLEDGTVFDSSEKHGKPLEVTLGQGQLIPGFEKALLGMEKDEEKEITLQPEEAYGQHNDQLVKKVPKEQLPDDQTPEVGMMITISLPNGMQIPAKITEVSDAEITIDMNPPLAGKVLKFKLKIVDIQSA